MNELQQMLDSQAVFQADMERSQDVAWGNDGPVATLVDIANAGIEEWVEFLRELPRKKWKRNYLDINEVDWDKARGEMIDELHFVLNGLLGVGFGSAEEIYEAYLEKHQVNNERQAQGY